MQADDQPIPAKADGLHVDINLLEPRAALRISHALSKVGGATEEHEAAVRWSNSALANVARADLLLHLATKTIGGSSASAAKLREMLDETIAPSMSPGDRELQDMEALRHENQPESEPDLNRQDHATALNPRALLRLLVGVAWASTDEKQLQRCLYGLGALTESLREAERLFDVASAALGGLLPIPLLTPMSFGAPPNFGPGDPFPPGRGPVSPPGIEDIIGRGSFKKPTYVAGVGYIIPILSNHKDVINCAMRFMATLPSLQAAAPHYRIDSISNANACPGDLITLTGINFGAPGFVVFPFAGTDPNGAGYVQADAWSDTQIVVRVPTWARPGTLELHVFERTIQVCRQQYDLYRMGDALPLFTGGVPSVFSLSVDGQSTAPVVVKPGATATITWLASEAPNVNCNVDVTGPGGTVFSYHFPTGGVGSVSFQIPTVSVPTDFTVGVTASGPCGSNRLTLLLKATVKARIVIDGLEITQGIQTYWNSASAPNSLPTVEGKDTIVRAYVYADRQGFLSDKLTDMKASLDVDGVVYAPINGVSPTTTTPTLSMDLGPRSAIDRSQGNNTFNFRIPAWRCIGTRRLELAVWGQDELGGIYQSYITVWTWTPNNPLRVRWVRVTSGGPGGSGATPTDAEARFTVERALELLPTPPTDIGPAWLTVWNTTQDLGTKDGFETLRDNLHNEHTCNDWESFWSTFDLTECPSDDGAYWVGVLPDDPNLAENGISEIGRSTCIARLHSLGQGATSRARGSAAHELMHCLGYRHVNRGCPPKPNPAGPFDSHPDNGDVTDVPFDPFWNQPVGTRNVGSVQDIMTYGCLRWTSAYHWTALLSRI